MLKTRKQYWSIVTNGFAYNENVHEKLMSAKMTALTLSLDGLVDNHNWLRNHNLSFNKAIDALKLITNENNLNYDVVTCVNRRNINELVELKKFLISKNVRAWRLFTISPIGRAKDNEKLVLQHAEINYLMNFIVETRNEGKIHTNFSCEAYTGKYEKYVRDNYFFCRAGVNIASVLIDGSISACPNINRSFVQGNLYKDDLLEIWNSKFEIMRNRNWCKVGKCASCNDYKRCNGGAMHLWNENKKDIL